MAGTDREDGLNDESWSFDDSDGESDTIDGLDVDDAEQAAQAGAADVEDDQGSGGGLLSRFRGGGEAAVDEADQEAVDEDGGGLLASVRERFQDDDEPGEPTRAELVDGANVLFIDPAAKRKSLYEYDLVLITAPAYPEPIVLKNDVPIEIPEGSLLGVVDDDDQLRREAAAREGEHPRPAGAGRRGRPGLPRARSRGGRREDDSAAGRPGRGLLPARPQRLRGVVGVSGRWFFGSRF